MSLRCEGFRKGWESTAGAILMSARRAAESTRARRPATSRSALRDATNWPHGNERAFREGHAAARQRRAERLVAGGERQLRRNNPVHRYHHIPLAPPPARERFSTAKPRVRGRLTRGEQREIPTTSMPKKPSIRARQAAIEAARAPTQPPRPAIDHIAPGADARPFLRLVGESLDGNILHYSERVRLIRVADRMGIARFEANLLIATVQHRAAQQPATIPALAATTTSRAPRIIARPPRCSPRSSFDCVL